MVDSQISWKDALSKQREVYDNLETCLESVGSTKKPFGKVAVGLRPSGLVHVGNVASIVNAFVVANALNARGVDLTICDSDQPNAKEPGNRPHFRILYNRLEDDQGCHSSIAEHRSEVICATAKVVKQVAQQHYCREFSLDTMNLSDVTADFEFRRALIGLFDSYDKSKLVRRIVTGYQKNRGKNAWNQKVYIPCGDCNATPHGETVVKLEDPVEDTQFIGARGNYECETCSYGQTISPLKELEKEIAVHFMLDPIRDIALSRYKDEPVRAHVFGGDYERTTGQHHARLVDLIYDILELAGGSIPIFTGPAYVGKDGQKMSKSRGNGMPIDTRNVYRSIGRLFPVQARSIENGIKVIHFDEIDSALNYDKERRVHLRSLI